MNRLVFLGLLGLPLIIASRQDLRSGCYTVDDAEGVACACSYLDENEEEAVYEYERLEDCQEYEEEDEGEEGDAARRKREATEEAAGAGRGRKTPEERAAAKAARKAARRKAKAEQRARKQQNGGSKKSYREVWEELQSKHGSLRSSCEAQTRGCRCTTDPSGQTPERPVRYRRKGELKNCFDNSQPA
jgi:hypothetical protein